MKVHLIIAYIGLFLLAFNGTNLVLNFNVLNFASTTIAFMVAAHHWVHYRELKALKYSMEETARVVTLANDALAPLNKQILRSLCDFQYQMQYWPCTKNTVVTEGKEYMWYGIKKNDTFVSIGGYRGKDHL